MAGGRKGHELFSARHPTISINTRLGLSVHSSEEAKATAQGCAVEKRRNAWGQGQERKEENDRVEIALLGREKTGANES